MLSEYDSKVLAHVWEIMNGIRARDGAPTHWCPEYFSDLCDKLQDVFETNAPGDRGVHLHPLLYKSYEKVEQ
jgi:hypothetical protein